MKWKKYSPISAVQAMGIIAMIIVGGVGAMTVMSLQYEPGSGEVIATLIPTTHYTSVYQVSDYGAAYYHDGNPYYNSVEGYAGKSLNITLTPKVLAVDSVYLMRINKIFRLLENIEGTEGWFSYVHDPSKDVIKIAEYDQHANVVYLGVVDIPENDCAGSTWWLIYFCVDMGYSTSPDWNPDGKVIVDIEVV